MTMTNPRAKGTQGAGVSAFWGERVQLSSEETFQAVKPAGLDRGGALSDRSYLLLTLACLGVLLAVRLAALKAAQIDLVMDEAQYWTWSRSFEFGYFSKPPLIAWIISGAGELCGQSEACVRAASPVLYTLSAFMLFATGRVLFDARIGFWAALVFATLPGVSYASLLITTDAPLIFAWTLMLFFWVMLVKRQSMGFAILLGLALGVGLLAKQAMIYALVCITAHAAVSREARAALKGGRGLAAGVIALALFSPNIVWNAEHGFPTAKHTGANIGWQAPYIHPIALLEFLGAQFGLFGPILIVVLARAAYREIRAPSDPNKTLLLCFSLPVLALLIVQALLSRAHGNWAATAYPAAGIFVTAVLLERGRRLLFNISLGLHLLLAAALATAPAFARTWPVFEQLKFLRSSLGWNATAKVVRAKLAEAPYGALLVDTREMAAEMLYYLRDQRLPLYVWPRDDTPHDHFEMTRPFVPGAPEPILFVSFKPCPEGVTRAFSDVTAFPAAHVRLVRDEARLVYTCRLAGYEGK
jgi:4-amino-4-deoxy-L-arabinose transferase-like glycosyltransferase